MNLVQAVIDHLDVDEERAIKGLGALFLAIRMAVDMKTFTQIASAFPDSGQWMLEAPFQGGGTGEMLAMATPGAVRRILLIAGFDDNEIHGLCETVGSGIKASVTPDTYRSMVENLPLFD